MQRDRRNTGQSFLEYAVLMCAVVVALFTMQGYLVNGGVRANIGVLENRINSPAANPLASLTTDDTAGVTVATHSRDDWWSWSPPDPYGPNIGPGGTSTPPTGGGNNFGGTATSGGFGPADSSAPSSVTG